MPSSLTDPAVPSDRQRDVPATVRVLGRVIQQIGHDLGQPGHVSVHPDRLVRHGDGEIVTRLFDGWAARLHGSVDHRPEFDDGPTEFQFAARHPAHVEQVVHQPDDLQAVADRGQRVTKFVGQCRQELVLAW